MPENELEKKASIIKRYPIETFLIVLMLAVGYLVKEQSTLKSENFQTQKSFNDFLKDDRVETIKIIERNTNVINRNNEIIENLKK